MNTHKGNIVEIVSDLLFQKCDLAGAVRYCEQCPEDDKEAAECRAFLTLIESADRKQGQTLITINAEASDKEVMNLLEKAGDPDQKLGCIGTLVVDLAVSDYTCPKNEVRSRAIQIEDQECYQTNILYKSQADCGRAEEWVRLAERFLNASSLNPLYHKVAAAFEYGVRAGKMDSACSQPVVSSLVVENLKTAAEGGSSQAMVRLARLIRENKEHPLQRLRHLLYLLLVIPVINVLAVGSELFDFYFGDFFDEIFGEGIDTEYAISIASGNSEGYLGYYVDTAALFSTMIRWLVILVVGACIIIAINEKVKSVDNNRIRRLLESAAEAGDSEARYQLGRFWQEKDPKRALQLYQEAAGDGNADAWLMLEKCYTEGIGTDADDEKAKDCQRRYLTVYREQNGDFIKDPVKADAYYKKAADSGDADSILKYADFLESHENPDSAEKYFQEAVRRGGTEEYVMAYGDFLVLQGRTDDRIELYTQYIKEDNNSSAICVDLATALRLRFHLNIIKCYQDHRQAARLMKQAADLGNGEAIYELQSHGIHSWKTEKRLVLKAAEAGYTVAMVELVRKYKRKQPDQALMWAKNASEKKGATGLCALAYCYEHGIGTPSNMTEAARLYMEAERRASYHYADILTNLSAMLHFARIGDLSYARDRLIRAAMMGRFDKLNFGIAGYEGERRLKNTVDIALGNLTASNLERAQGYLRDVALEIVTLGAFLEEAGAGIDLRA